MPERAFSIKYEEADLPPESPYSLLSLALSHVGKRHLLGLPATEYPLAARWLNQSLKGAIDGHVCYPLQRGAFDLICTFVGIQHIVFWMLVWHRFHEVTGRSPLFGGLERQLDLLLREGR